ncbi:RHS repeat-associated core domain-containing protein [Agitococcus lubricus]|uniref:RHS repeat-associated protein n=1 Tax=Agitococcus lubricus TaxID=1077255 RepID=A0A2T5J217_9GAMM|nr:RHS repeat-associated core domain-containing protein [Agitococcus lubricus]PTQ90492.1 RHS repeat-associated protein [Agitococcus lubricus]
MMSSTNTSFRIAGKRKSLNVLSLLTIILFLVNISVVHAAAGDVVQTTVISNTYDSYGNLTLSESTITVTEPSGSKVYNQKNINTYNNIDVTNWRLGLLSCQLIWSDMPSDTQLGAGDLVAATAISYSYFTDSIKYGLLQAQNSGIISASSTAPTTCTAPTTFVTNTYSYDNFGNLLSTSVSGSDFTSRSTSQTYDASNRFVKTKTNELGQTETITYDFEEGNLPARGLVTRQKGPNLLETKWEYDEIGRRTKETRPDGTYTILTYANCSTDCEASEIYKITSTNYRANGSLIDAADITYYDRFDRAVRSKTTSFDNKTLITGKKVYNNLGQVVETYSSHILPLAANDSLNNYKTTISYDALGRPLQTTEPSGLTSKVSYTNSFETTTTIYPTTNTNGIGQKKTERKNGLGRLVEVIDNANNSLKYVYDLKGNLRKTIDAVGNVTEIQYNGLGQKTKMIDPNLGEVAYSYNLLGELLTVTDAIAKDKGGATPTPTMTMTYDKLGRMLTRTEADLSSTWTYDTASKGIGKIASESSTNGYSRTYSYDSLGRNHTVTTTLDNTSYTTTNTYDDAGRANSFIYPTNVSYKNIYDANGYLSEVRDANSQALYWRAIKRDADGHVLEEQLGNGLTTKRSYKATTGYVDTIQTGATASFTASVQNDTYTFDNYGNLTFRNEALNNVAEAYGYDGLNRLTSATRGGDIRTVSYDALGRIYYKSDVGVYAYGQAITEPNIYYNPNWISYGTWVPIGSVNGVLTLKKLPNKPPIGNPLSPTTTLVTNLNCGGIHRVCGIGGTLNTTFTYDANGNMMTGNGRTYTWTSFNMPASITQGSNSETFIYNANYERVKRTSVDNGQTTTTYYLNPRLDLGGTFEKNMKPDNSIEYVHHIYAGGQAIGSVVTTDVYTAPVTQWATDLSVSPSTANPNSVGISLATDPNGLITWDNSTGNGRLAITTKPTTSSVTVTATAQRSYLSDNVIFKAEITTSTNTGNGRYLIMDVFNNGTNAAASKTLRRHALYLRSGTVYASVVDGSATDVNGNLINILKNLGALQDNTTYVAEIETTPTTSVLYFYPQGQTRANGYSHRVELDWRGANGTGSLVRRLRLNVNTNANESVNPTYVDNLSESKFIAQGTRYFHTDHLGSISSVTNATGTVLERFSYDAWGKRRAIDGLDASGIKSTSTKHGFTGHEALDSIGLVHMNGRVYDPVVGRFVSADPFIDGVKNLQGFNRYSYVKNNPLSFIDLTGFNTQILDLDAGGSTVIVTTRPDKTGPAPEPQTGGFVVDKKGQSYTIPTETAKAINNYYQAQAQYRSFVQDFVQTYMPNCSGPHCYSAADAAIRYMTLADGRTLNDESLGDVFGFGTMQEVLNNAARDQYGNIDLRRGQVGTPADVMFLLNFVQPELGIAKLAASLGMVGKVANGGRGLSSHGGSFSSSVNQAGGEVWTATGQISQNDFATYVNSGLYKGDVNIISGVHGTPAGVTIPDLSLFKADVSRFGNIPGVNVYDFTKLSPQQLTDLLRGPGTTIGGFCDSGVCLAPFK